MNIQYKKMTQKQKNKFHNAIESLSELMEELNSEKGVWELRYNQSNMTFKIGVYCSSDTPFTDVEYDETYFPNFYIEE